MPEAVDPRRVAPGHENAVPGIKYVSKDSGENASDVRAFGENHYREKRGRVERKKREERPKPANAGRFSE